MSCVRETSPLASVQLVHTPIAIKNKDRIVCATVNGYNVIVQKAVFFPQEDIKSCLCVFFEPDSLLPDKPEWNFLDSRTDETGIKRLVKTMRMSGVYSQGLCMPLSILAAYGIDPNSVVPGEDVTNRLGVTKYVTDDEKFQYDTPNSESQNKFPVDEVPKTDEVSLQSHPGFLNQLVGRRVTITIKADGSSMTVTSSGKVCGRNYTWIDKDRNNSMYFEVVEKLDAVAKIQNSGYCVQGELVGPKIQQNHLGFQERHWLVFNVWKNGQYLPHSQVNQLCRQWGFETVPCLYEDVAFEELPMKSVSDFLEFAEKQTYVGGHPAEGIVIKTSDNDKGPRISFKVISRKYVLK